MSLKTRTARSRSPPARAPSRRPRPRVLPLLVASKASAPPGRLLCTSGRRPFWSGRRRRFRRYDQTSAAAAAHLAALASRVARLVGGPLVGGPLLMRRPPALAGDLALLLRGHRREASSFLTLCTHRSALRLFTTPACEPCRVPCARLAAAVPGCAGDAVRRGASPALRRGPCRADRGCLDPAGTRTIDARCSSALPPDPSVIKVCASSLAQPRFLKLLKLL